MKIDHSKVTPFHFLKDMLLSNVIFQEFEHHKGNKESLRANKRCTYSCFLNYTVNVSDNNLSEKHERVVGSQVLGEELHTVTLQSRDSVLLGRIQSRHHSLWTNVDLVRIQEPVQRKTGNRTI